MTLPSGSLIRLNFRVSQRNNKSLDSVYLTFQRPPNKIIKKEIKIKFLPSYIKYSKRFGNDQKGAGIAKRFEKTVKNHKMVRFTGFKLNSRRRTGDRMSHLTIVITCRGLSIVGDA
jgi:hypothetical protein